MLASWGSSASVLAFEEIALDYADFTDDASCAFLGNFINDAANLNALELWYQNDSRPVTVTYTPATSADANDGVITIVEMYGEQLECFTRNTSRTTSLDMSYDQDFPTDGARVDRQSVRF